MRPGNGEPGGKTPRRGDESADTQGGAAAPAAPDTPGSGQDTTPNVAEPAGHAAASAPAPRAFAVGEVVGGRYRVARFIARGGMGEVYEAEDLGLKGVVALKTIRTQASDDERAVERFKREIQIARRITHPNVCRIHDLAVHQSPAGGEILFLTMELLRGDTLQAHVAKYRRLSMNEALPLVEQMAAGLHAAHELGIIHRDFKSANVILVPSATRGRTPKAVVTDFGLARAITSEDGSASISDSGKVAGTPAYMAPEQVEGKELGPAADIYALGIVLYEMMTGTLPFEGSSAISVAARRLTHAPDPPRKHVADLDARWDAVILRCLERDPARRFASAPDVGRALRSDAPLPSPPTQSIVIPESKEPSPFSPRAWPKHKALAAGAAALVAVILIGYALKQAGGPSSGDDASPSATAAPAASLRPTLAILPLRSASAVDAWRSTAIAELLRVELKSGGTLKVTPIADVTRAARDLGVGSEGVVDDASLGRVARALGAAYLVSGTQSSVGGADSSLVRVELLLHQADRKPPVASASITGTETQLVDVVARAAAELRSKIGLAAPSAEETVKIRVSAPTPPEALRWFFTGLTRLRESDPSEARTLLERAVAAAPEHGLTRAALAQAWNALGFAERAQEETKLALPLLERLPEVERWEAAAALHEANKDWERATSAWTTLAALHPDDVDYGVRLAESQTLGGKVKEALATIEGLRRLPSPAAEDPRIDIAHARASQELGDFKQAQSLAARAAARSRSLGARTLVARARLLEATARENLGDSTGAAAAIDEARSIYEALGDRAGLARTLERTALAVYGRGDLAGARRLYERALETHKALADNMSVARVLVNMGNILRNAGGMTEAMRNYEEGLVTFRRIGARWEEAATLNAMAARLQAGGDLAGAQKRYEEALQVFAAMGERSAQALVLTNIGELLYFRGQLDRAREMHEEALALNREGGDKSGAGYDLYRLGEVFAAKGDLRVAADRYREALALQEPLRDKSAAFTRLGLARTLLFQRQAKEAEAAAREVEEIVRTQGMPDAEAEAQAVMAEALLAQGKLPDAQRAAARAAELAANSEDFKVRLAARIVGARVKAAAGETDAALAELTKVAAEARKLGSPGFAFEAGLAAAQIGVAARRPGAKGRLDAVGAEARKKGFGTIASRAVQAAH